MINRNQGSFWKKIVSQWQELKGTVSRDLNPLFMIHTQIDRPSQESALIRIRNRYLNQRLYVGRTELLSQM